MNGYSFPDNFIFGGATSAIQVEGSPRTDGAGETVWGALTERKGYFVNDADFSQACDQFHRYSEDVALMKSLGIQAYRFSINWARVFPDGDGRPNPKGLDYYNKLVDELLAAGIKPFATLFHWELPQSLETRFGGWRSKRVPHAFADYAAHVANKLGDRVKDYFTVNEIGCFTHGAYEPGGGYMAPAVDCSLKEKNQTVHNGALAHGLAVQALRAGISGKVSVGLAENAWIALPAYESAEHIAAAKKAFREYNAGKLTLICEGAYLRQYLDQCGADAPEYDDNELKIIASPLDFVGINIYNGQYVAADTASACGYKVLPWPEIYPRMDMDWARVTPDALYWGMRFTNELWKPDRIYITENGCAARDRRELESGEIYDTDRVMFMREYLKGVHRAISEGIPAAGYFAWSLLDNFEWREAYGKRFGIVHVDYRTQERTPKLSAKFYAETIRSRRLA